MYGIVLQYYWSCQYLSLNEEGFLSNLGSEMHGTLAMASLVTAHSSLVFGKRLLILRFTKQVPLRNIPFACKLKMILTKTSWILT